MEDSRQDKTVQPSSKKEIREKERKGVKTRRGEETR